MGEPNYIGLLILYLAPSFYFFLKEMIYLATGFKFCWRKGITIGFVPGIGHIAAVSDLFEVLFGKNRVERNRSDCR